MCFNCIIKSLVFLLGRNRHSEKIKVVSIETLKQTLSLRNQYHRFIMAFAGGKQYCCDVYTCLIESVYAFKRVP